MCVFRILKILQNCFLKIHLFERRHAEFDFVLWLQGKVDEYRLSMNKQMLEIISEVRKEGVEKIINLKKKFGSTKDNSALEEHLAQVN